MNIPKKFNELGLAIQTVNKEAGNTQGVSKLLASLSADNLSQINKSFSEIAKSGGFKELYTAADGLGSAMAKLTTQQKISIITSQNLNKSQMMAALTSAGLTDAEIAQAFATSTLNTAQKAATASTWSWKAAWDGLKVAIATNPIGIAITAITLAASVAIPIFQKLSSAKQDVIDRANELTEAFKTQQSAIQTAGVFINSISSEYEKLSRGLDSNGKVISLNAEETKRLFEINNQIADLFPQMIQGYTDEGNAIITHAGNIDELTHAYKEMKQAAQDAILVGASDVFKGFNIKVNEPGFWSSTTGLSNQLETVEKLIDFLNSDYSFDKNAIVNFPGNFNDIQDIVERAGISPKGIFEDYADFYERIQSETTKIIAVHRQMVSELNAETAKVSPILNALLDTDFNFKQLDDDTQNSLKSLLSNFDRTFFRQFGTETEMYDWIEANLIQPLNDPSISFQMQSAIQSLLNPEFDGKSASQVDEYIQGILSDIEKTAPKLFEKLTPEILIKLGFDLDLESAKQAVLEAQTELSKFTGEQLAGEFTRAELNLLINTDDDAFVSTSTNIKDLRAEFDAWRESVANAARDDSFRVSLENTTEKVTMLKNAMDEQSQSGYISAETYGALYDAGEDYRKLLDETSGGLVLLSSETESYIGDLVGLAIQQGVINGYTREQINSFYQLFVATSNLDNQLDSVQSAYQKLVAAQDEYAANGYLSIDTLQSLLDVGYEYLQYLEFEDGQMRVNEDGFIALANARLDDLEASELQKATNLLNKFSQDAEGAAKLRSEINLLTDSRLADAEAAYNQAMASAMASGGEYADAAKDLADTVSKVRAVIDTTRNSLGSYTRETMNAKSASDSLKDSQNALKNAMSAINTLLSMTISMLKKDYELKKKAIQDQIDAINTSAKAQIDAANAAHKAEKDNLNDLKKSYDKMFKDRKQALDDEHDALKKKIELQIKLLKLQEEEHDYQRDLADKQKEVADIQGELFKIQFDDSIEGQKRRLELEAQLAEKTDALSEFQHDKEIDRQEQALRDELDRISEIHKNKMDLLDQDKQANDDYFDQRMAQLDAEHERTITYLESARDAQVASLDAQIKAIEDYLSTEAGIREEATKLIEGRTQEFYDRLIQYNYLYSNGVDEDVRQAWNNAYSALDKFNVGQLGVMGVLNSLTRQMDEFKTSTSRAASQMESLVSIAKSMPTISSIVSEYSNIVALGTVAAAAKSLALSGGKTSSNSIPKFASGGVNNFTGLAELHGTPKSAEVVFNATDASKLWRFINDADNLGDKIVSRILGGFNGHKAISNMSNVTTNNSNPVSVAIGDININGSDGSISKNDLGSFRDNIVNTVMEKIVKQHNIHNKRNLNYASI